MTTMAVTVRTWGATARLASALSAKALEPVSDRLAEALEADPRCEFWTAAVHGGEEFGASFGFTAVDDPDAARRLALDIFTDAASRAGIDRAGLVLSVD